MHLKVYFRLRSTSVIRYSCRKNKKKNLVFLTPSKNSRAVVVFGLPRCKRLGTPPGFRPRKTFVEIKISLEFRRFFFLFAPEDSEVCTRCNFVFIIPNRVNAFFILVRLYVYTLTYRFIVVVCLIKIYNINKAVEFQIELFIYLFNIKLGGFQNWSRSCRTTPNREVNRKIMTVLTR